MSTIPLQTLPFLFLLLSFLLFGLGIRQPPGKRRKLITAVQVLSILACLHAFASTVVPFRPLWIHGTILITLYTMVATQFCCGVIGGGGFMLVRDAEGRFEFVDYRETAPAASTEEMFNNNASASLIGDLSARVTGEIRGLEYLHSKYGSLPWADLVDPSVKMAKQGFVVGKDMESQMDRINDETLFPEDPAWAPEFAPERRLLRAGDTITRPRLAKTLERIRDGGADAFYTGVVAETMVEALRKRGGIMTLQDLRDYRIIHRRPMSIHVLQGYADRGKAAALNLTSHRLSEIMRFAFGARIRLGDPDFVDGLEPPGTSHISTADASGLAISSTSTINLTFGSRLMVPETGIIMNNEMDDFSVPNTNNSFGFVPSPANFIRPGKRPLSSMSPLIVKFEGNRTLHSVLGGAVGSRIITAVVQGVWNLLDRELGIVEAVAAARLHDQLIPNQILVQKGFDNGTIAFLEGRGHKVVFVSSGHGSDLQMVQRLTNATFVAASEPRQLESGGFAV
ncbi:gamma-glutamyltranspeptidase-like protein [Schizothecium vesticola]|uniref:Gamma-glutamyltranspeptidase-like protein n=1 Tax=Schizothecium vesticola TaxID=314040 RepID=A0AA40EWE9_9PEZI|nr:gamma-glutamyltranspeptidase-like protein [Schizothecium vesticola]